MNSSSLTEFIQFILKGRIDDVARDLRSSPPLATMAMTVGASRQRAADFFFPEINHYVYEGDTALHVAAAAHSREAARLLIAHGANCRARNRRGAEPLHYAADGSYPDAPSPADVIDYLASVGANPNAIDKSGVTPLHRAVRARATAAVEALLDTGASPTQRNKSGSTPLHLAVQTTGASGSGSPDARQRQEVIIRILLARGARLTDEDGKGRTVAQAATSEWIRELLAASGEN